MVVPTNLLDGLGGLLYDDKSLAITLYLNTETILRAILLCAICDQRDSDSNSITVFGVSSGSHPND